MFAFEKLNVWKDATALTIFVYGLLEHFPRKEMFALTGQIRRSVASVAANLAEGSARTSGKDQAHFTTIAYSSLMETMSHLLLAGELGYIGGPDIVELRKRIENIATSLGALRKSQISRS